MSDIPPEMASHAVEEGMYAVRLHGGPWDGREVGIRDPQARLIGVNGPRGRNHGVWITHLYQQRGGRYEFVSTHVASVAADC